MSHKGHSMSRPHLCHNPKPIRVKYPCERPTITVCLHISVSLLKVHLSMIDSEIGKSFLVDIQIATDRILQSSLSIS